MIVAVVGSRVGVSQEFVHKSLDTLLKEGWIPKDALIVSGGADGVDSFAWLWAFNNQMKIKVIRPVRYEKLELLKRDAEIVKLADKLVAFKSKESLTKGTDYTYSLALKKGIPAKIFYYPIAEGFE